MDYAQHCPPRSQAYAPENTLPAFAKAKNFGCQMFEMDARLSKDGSVIVHHDEPLSRCTDVTNKFPGRASYKVSDFTLAELKQLDAGSSYVAQLALPALQRWPYLQSLSAAEMASYISPAERELYASGTVRIPTLVETLVLAKANGLKVNIELKTQGASDAQLVKAVLDIVRAQDFEPFVLISSFEHTMLREIRQYSKTIATAALSELPLKAPIGYLRHLKANAYNLSCYKGLSLNGFSDKEGRHYLTHIQKILKAGFGVNIWTCNHPDELKYLLAAGISGLISDYPNRVQDALTAFGLTTPPSSQQNTGH
ncbi:MAG: glycerophosphodiester phosphodiesterase family protein [Cypionkella sp.]